MLSYSFADPKAENIKFIMPVSSKDQFEEKLRSFLKTELPKLRSQLVEMEQKVIVGQIKLQRLKEAFAMYKDLKI